MRVPNESLDDFASRADARKRSDPPSPVTLRPSGETEVLKPLRLDLIKNRSVRRTFRWPALSGLSGFHRSLALGGACAVTVFILGISVYFGIYGPPVEQAASTNDLAAIRQKKRSLTPPKVPSPFERRPITSSPAMSDEPNFLPTVAVRRRGARPRLMHAVYRVRHLENRRQLAVTKFIPTTLIIYVENGEVRSRIEPQLTAAYKKPATIPN